MNFKICGPKAKDQRPIHQPSKTARMKGMESPYIFVLQNLAMRQGNISLKGEGNKVTGREGNKIIETIYRCA